MGPSEARALAYLLMASQGQGLATCQDALALGWLEGLQLIDTEGGITERGRSLARLIKGYTEYVLANGRIG